MNLNKLFKNFTKENTLKLISNTLLVLLGTFILAMGTEMFIIPQELDTGGVSGIAICFKYAGIEFSTEIIIGIIGWILFFLGLIFLGWSFSAQTLISTITYPLFLLLINFICSKYSFLLIAESQSLAGNPALITLLSSLFGGILVGAGCAITFVGGGSTGGVDIITFIICKYFKRIKSSASIFIIDAIIVILGFIINKDHDIALCLEGVFSAFIAALVVDRIFVGQSDSFAAYIITDKYQEITDEVINKLNRTTSILDIEGGYTKEMKKMLIVSFTIRQYTQVMSIITRYDRKAFTIIHRTHEIDGEGFKELKE
ncbi:YitT family protein [bacterium]|nr:YitT family protein [bacterium]